MDLHTDMVSSLMSTQVLVVVVVDGYCGSGRRRIRKVTETSTLRCGRARVKVKEVY